jgi:hypothetical protein
MSSSTSSTICPQCTYDECMREYNTNSNLYINCPYCGYYESWVGAEHYVAPGAGCISYIVSSGAVHIQYLPTAAEVESAAQWLREHLSTGTFRKGYVTRWEADNHTVETIVGRFGNFFFEIPGIDLDDLGDDQAPDPVHLDPFDTATDTVTDGSPRCDLRYHGTDIYGDVDWARCTRVADTRVLITETSATGTMGCPLAVEILGGLK